MSLSIPLIIIFCLASITMLSICLYKENYNDNIKKQNDNGNTIKEHINNIKKYVNNIKQNNKNQNKLNKQIYPKKNTTIVTGYWKIKNKHGNEYEKWFNNTLMINCPYIFFGDNETISLVKNIRKNLPTFYVNISIKDFYTYKYYDSIKIDSYHCPSKELNIIWNEKIFLIKKAKDINIFNSEYFLWVDAGICIYRETHPPKIEFPNQSIMNLPKNKFIFTSSDNTLFEKEKIGSYYHFISGTYCIHLNFIDTYTDIYKKYVDKYIIKDDNIYTDQLIHTLIYNDYPEIFYNIGHGYGKIVEILY